MKKVGKRRGEERKVEKRGIYTKRNKEKSRRSTLPLKDILIQLDPHVLGHILHLRFDVIFHAASQPEELPDLGKPEEDIAGEQHDAEDDVPA